MKILVTGGAGFIGSNFIRYLLKKYPSYQIINLDKLTYAGNLDNLKDIPSLINSHSGGEYTFIQGDILDSALVNQLLGRGIEVIINFAAESHVDRSIEDPSVFIKTNVLGTNVLMKAALHHGVSRFIQISTDEVYGSLGPEGKFKEDSPLRPNSPYAASKASADLLLGSYEKTFNFPGIIARPSNNYGPYQFPEKLIPLFITNTLRGEPLPLYGDGLNVRDWIYVEDTCSALDLILNQGKIGEIYNISASSEKTNLEITKIILAELKRPESLIHYVQDRPGHDRRYALDWSKIKKELNWSPQHSFLKGIRQTIAWYQQNQEWWQKIKGGEYREYYQKMYGTRL